MAASYAFSLPNLFIKKETKEKAGKSRILKPYICISTFDSTLRFSPKPLDKRKRNISTATWRASCASCGPSLSLILLFLYCLIGKCHVWWRIIELMQTEREVGSLIHRSAVKICTLLKLPFLSCLLIAFEPFHSIALVPSFRIHGCPAFTKKQNRVQHFLF